MYYSKATKVLFCIFTALSEHLREGGGEGGGEEDGGNFYEVTLSKPSNPQGHVSLSQIFTNLPLPLSLNQHHHSRV